MLADSRDAVSPAVCLAVALASLAGAPAQADDLPLALQPSPRLVPAPAGDKAPQRPIILRADSLQVRPERDAIAQGAVEFRRAGTLIQADTLTYDNASDLATARGQVLIQREGARYSGPELQIHVQRFEGFFLQPRFEFTKINAGGQAERIDFIDANRLRATKASYTSCTRADYSSLDVTPDWLLRTDRIRLDFEANEGIAEGAVLQFLGVPILGFPVLSFPISDDRKSGWLPPTLVPIDSRNGFTLAVPYYWNIAPDRDATLVPTLLARRGMALDSEFRYLEPLHSGRLRWNWLPQDRLTNSARHAWEHDLDGQWPGATQYRLRFRRVSDDAYWKDFPRSMPNTPVPRLLTQDMGVERVWASPVGDITSYARVQHWQVLQTGSGVDLIVAPYQRSPQLGLRLGPALLGVSPALRDGSPALRDTTPALPGGLRLSLETEINHFTRPDGSASTDLPTGWRWHALGAISRPFTRPGLWLTPTLKFNAAAYALDAGTVKVGQSAQAQRLVPTFSVDAGMVLERRASWFGRPQRQTLEPRLLYVNTPFREQSVLPNFDAAERDFNAVSIYADNAFSGVDRVSDAHQVTTGFTTRLVDAQTGAETLRLSLAQRIRFRDQRVVASGDTLQQRLSDVLAEGATSVFNPWLLDATLQYNPDTQRVVRSIIGARYSPAPFYALSARYRLAKGLSEQVELGWQWPVYRGTARPVGASGGCGGTLYAVGRLNYSLKDSRATDAIAGIEYDTGCWIGRVLAERLSTGRAEASTRLLLQLELVGLSRLGANPLQVLKDNIPGYRLLREPSKTPPPTLEP